MSSKPKYAEIRTRNGNGWMFSEKEDEEIRRLHAEGRTIDEIADELERPRHSVYNRMCELRLGLKRRSTLSLMEKNYIRLHRNDGIEAVSDALGLEPHEIEAELRRAVNQSKRNGRML